jgi:capsular exopolysaccharide synthesis family protein
MTSDLPIEEIDFHSYWLILQRRWKPALGVFLVTTAATFLYATREETTYTAEAKLIFKSDRSTLLTGLGEALGRVESLTFEANPLDTQVEVIQSYPILNEVIQDLALKDEDNKPITPSHLAKSLTVEPIPGTDIVSIVYTADDPELAAQVPNSIADVFIQNNIQQNRAEATAARDFISQQLPQTEAALNQAENNLRAFKERNQIVVLSEEASALVTAAFALQNQINTVEAQIVNLDSITQDYQNQLNIDDTQQAIILAALSESTGVQKALEDLQVVEQEIAANRSLFTENSQTINRLNTRRRNLEAILNQRVSEVVNGRVFSENTNIQIGDLQINLIGDLVTLEAQKLGLQNQVNLLGQQMIRYNERMIDLPSLERQQSQLERDLAVAQQTYETLLSRFQELQIAESQNVGTVRIISPAITPEEPIPSSKKVLFMAGMVVGSLLGITAAFVLDLLDGSIKTLKQAKGIFGYPVLGILPKISKEDSIIFPINSKSRVPPIFERDMDQSSMSEACRLLQANLSILNTEAPIKTVLISSSDRQEGRSMVVANLAFNLSQTGKKVLIIDADYRSPIQHEIWELNNNEGLNSVVIDSEDPEHIMRFIAPRLSILTTGRAPSNPMTLLGSKRLESIISQLKDDYDYIIFDSPPLLGMADAILLGHLVDCLLLVARLGTVEVAKARQVKEALAQANIAVCGLIINDAAISQQKNRSIYERSRAGKIKRTLEEITPMSMRIFNDFK